jgi:hypothetical protein
MLTGGLHFRNAKASAEITVLHTLQLAAFSCFYSMAKNDCSSLSKRAAFR